MGTHAHTHAARCSGGYSLSSRIGEVEAPTLVVWGRNDGILDPRNAERFVEELPSGRLVWVEECGHFPALEQPARLDAAVREFVGGAAVAAGER
jgi:pimeloyl-ACP methyl ester carboxylesterase